MAATNKIRQLADYSEGGPGSSVELQLGYGFDIAIVIISVIACGIPV